MGLFMETLLPEELWGWITFKISDHMKKIPLYIVFCFLLLGVTILFFFFPRKVSFELTKQIEKPRIEFDYSYYGWLNYVAEKERLFFYLYEYYNSPKYSYNMNGLGCDSLYVENLSKDLDFINSDYLITYQRKLSKLHHSPYLTILKDGLYDYDKRIPLIPTWDKEVTDSLYIYRIKKNNRFRAPGP